MTAWISVVAALLAVAPGDAVLTTLDGEKIAGVVSDWDGKELTITTPDGESQLSSDALIEAVWPAAETAAAADRSVEFVDGSRLVFRSFTIADRVATFESPLSSRPLKAPTSQIRCIELVPPSGTLKEVLAAIAAKGPTGDSLVIVKRDAEAMDYLTGIVGDVSTEQVDFKWDGEQVPVKISKVAAIVFYHANENRLPAGIGRAHFTDGSAIVIRNASLKGDELRLESVAGVQVRAPLSQLARVDFSTGKVAYLSDLEPSIVRWIPRVALPVNAPVREDYGRPRRNLSFSGTPLTLLWDDASPSRRDIRTYERGLAVRSRTELAYHVPAGMSRLRLTAGIDPAAAGQGHVAFEIRGDDQVLWEGTIAGSEPPVEIDVQLGAARRLQLLVDYGENLDFGDRLHLIEARFTK